LTSLDAKTVAMEALPLPQLAELKGLGESLGKLASQYRQAGDEASAQAALQMGVALGRRVAEPSGQDSVIRNLLGIVIESKILGAMDPVSPYDSAGQTVKERLDELARQRQTIKEVVGNASDSVLQTLSEQDQLSYFERVKVSGELAALRWAQTRQAKR
jgi:small ligand-binding sensory domain FIST